jgi:RNA polymerase sigma-70 factor (ECF subfamily)
MDATNPEEAKFNQVKMDEQALIRKVQDGDEMAFEEIVSIYKNKIVNFLYQLVGDYEKATELAQETFLRVYFKADKYKPVAPLSSWIYTIASNLGKTELKKMRRYYQVSLEDVQNKVEQGVVSSENPESSGLEKNVREALDELHPRYRIPVLLKDVEGFTQEEIAMILKKPVGTIKARISRGRSYLKRELESAIA